MTFTYSTSAVVPTSQIVGDVEKAFKHCEDKIKSISGQENKFPSSKKPDSLNWDRNGYSETVKELNKYHQDKLKIVGAMLKDREAMINAKAPEDKINTKERDIGGELNAFVAGCSNSAKAVEAQILEAKPSLTDKFKNFF